MVTCGGCSGSGNQFAWLSYEERPRRQLSLTDSPVTLGHQQLREEKALLGQDVSAFSVVVSHEVEGILQAEQVEARLQQEHFATIDARCERIIYQQYLKLAVVRRDATFEMCGTGATVVLSGNELTGSTTPAAIRPIRIRLLVWVALAVLVLFVASGLLGGAIHPDPYFSRANGILGLLTYLGIGLAIPSIGALLRELGRGWKIRKLGPIERVVGIGSAGAFVMAMLIGVVSRPRLGEVEKALASKDVARARVVINALRTTRGETSEVLQADDAVMMAEAAASQGEAKLQLLDAVTARGGALTAEALKQSRQERIAMLKGAMEQGKPAEAIADVQRWFPNSTDAEVVQHHAAAEDALYEACPDDICRFAAAQRALAVQASPPRSDRVKTARDTLLAKLSLQPVEGEALASRLSRVNALNKFAADTKAAVSDPAVQAAADAALILAKKERESVALFGAEEAVVVQLVGPLDAKSATVSLTTTPGVFVVLDAGKRCRGIYAAKAKAAGANPVQEGLLSQAVGHPASFHQPLASTPTLSRWTEGGIPVVARWKDGTPVELRIGDAAP